jgi:acetyl-CoA C-acetyltransferase
VSAEPTAIVGIGQTKHKTRREDVSQAGLLREAAERALDDANMTWKDIDTVVIGKAPDAFEGVMMPELYLADALGAAGKPMMRVHTAGSVGGSTGIVASHLVSNRIHKRVLAVAYEKQSEGNAQWGLGGGKSGSMGAGGIFAPWIRAYIERSGAPEHIGWKVAVKDRLNALKNPYAHLQLTDISIDKVRESPMLWDPLHFLESCPSSDGAMAVVFTDEAGGKAAAQAGRQPAWILSTAMRSEPTQFPRRDPVRPAAGVQCAADVYAGAGITNPREQIDVAELYVPFSWYEPMWLEGHDIAPIGEGWKMADSGETEIGGAFPVNPSGGVLSSNPIGASGLIRFAEAALQVRGMAGEHQVDDAHVALAQAYGGGAQYFAMWVVADALDAVSRA